MWGNKLSERRLLMIHGIQDNCGSFDRIIPTLKGDYNILAVDLPGHGFSSHFPQGLPLEFLNFVLSIKIVLRSLNWNKFTYIGHSFGGQIGTYFAGIFPEYMNKLIILDTMGPRQLFLPDTLKHLQSTLNYQLDLAEKLNKNNVPIYSYQEALEKLVKNRPFKLTQEAAEILIKRSISPIENGFVFTFDQRLKNQPIPTLTFDQQVQVISNITCPTLYILADQNMERYNTYLKEIYKFICKKENCNITVVEGNHDVHQNYPEKVNFLIDNFL